MASSSPVQTRRAEVRGEILTDLIDASLQNAELVGVPETRDRRDQPRKGADHRRYRREQVPALHLTAVREDAPQFGNSMTTMAAVPAT